jgi:hypothetical protein
VNATPLVPFRGNGENNPHEVTGDGLPQERIHSPRYFQPALEIQGRIRKAFIACDASIAEERDLSTHRTLMYGQKGLYR